MNSRLPAIENALQNIQAACEKRLSKLYPAGIPEDIDSRYQQELSYLKKSPLIDDFEIFRRLCLEAEKSSNLIHARGTIPGSFLCFLLGNNSLNPLPVHYYCPDCGHYEKVMTHLFGIDLPPKKCPHSNSTMWTFFLQAVNIIFILLLREAFRIYLCHFFNHLHLPRCQSFQNGDDLLHFVKHIFPPTQKKRLE